MTNQAYPSVLEHECSWADIGVNFGIPGGIKLDVFDLTAIKWSRKVTVGETRAVSGGRVMKRTAGSEAVEGSAVFTRKGHALIVEALETAAIALGQVRGSEVIISGVAFEILIQHTPLGDSRIYTAKMSGCRFLSDASDMKEGNDGDTIEVDLSPIKVATLSASGNWIVLR